MKRLAVISASLLMLGFGGKAAFAQEEAKADKAAGGRTVTVFVIMIVSKHTRVAFRPGKKARKCRSGQIEWSSP